MGDQTRSFGRRVEERPPEPVLVIPPLRLTEVQLPVVLVVDSESLAAAAQQIQEMVKTAVLAGFNTAMDEVATLDGAAPGPPGS